MNDFLSCIIIGLIIVYLLTARTEEKFENIQFLPLSQKNNNPNWSSWPLTSWWSYMPWNQPTRFPRLYYDIRGDPNIVYRYRMFGGYSPYGYMFGPYLYDPQGNLLHDSKKPYYIA